MFARTHALPSSRSLRGWKKLWWYARWYASEPWIGFFWKTGEGRSSPYARRSFELASGGAHREPSRAYGRDTVPRSGSAAHETATTLSGEARTRDGHAQWLYAPRLVYATSHTHTQ